MARLFISHSGRNNDKAIEVRDWLAKNGWVDVFMDLDPERGIAAAQRWKEALTKAAYRCEVVLALVSNEWLASSWCKSEVDGGFPGTTSALSGPRPRSPCRGSRRPNRANG
jgi:TIR domain-containing protein